MAGAMQSQDPVLSQSFLIDVEGGMLKGLFTEVTGIGSEHEIIEHKANDARGNPVIMKIPGVLKWENITLKRGITDTMDAWTWRFNVENGDVEGNRFGGSITMLDHDNEPVAMWTFDRAWPTKLSGPAPKAGDNAVAIEEIVLAHEGIRRVQV